MLITIGAALTPAEETVTVKVCETRNPPGSVAPAVILVPPIFQGLIVIQEPDLSGTAVAMLKSSEFAQ